MSPVALLSALTGCTQTEIAGANAYGSAERITVPENTYSSATAPGGVVGVKTIDASTTVQLREALRTFLTPGSGAEYNANLIINPAMYSDRAG